MILLGDAIPRILIPAGRADVLAGKPLTLHATIESATASIADRQRPRDLLLWKDLINTPCNSACLRDNGVCISPLTGRIEAIATPPALVTLRTVMPPCISALTKLTDRLTTSVV